MTWSARFARMILALLLTTVSVAAGIVLPVSPAQAADPLAATVTLSSVVTDDSGLTISGTVTNTGPAIYKAQVSLWRDRATISTHDQLDAALATDPNTDTGDRVTVGDAVAVISSGRTAFAEADTADFTVHASWADLGIADNGVYLVGVHVRGASSQWSSLTTITRARTLITIAHDVIVQSAKVVMLSSSPSLLHDSVFVDDHLVNDLRGRLGTLLKQAEKSTTTWAIDPLLYTEVTIMAAGYKVIVNGEEVDGTGQNVARAWLDEFSHLPKNMGYRLPYGNPDFSIGVASNDSWMVDQALAATIPDQIDSLPLLVRAKNGMGNLAWLNYIAPLHPDVVLMASPAAGTLSTPRSATVTTIIPTLVTPYPIGPDSDSSDLQVAQRAQAENYLAGTSVVRVIDNEQDASTALRLADGFTAPDSLRHFSASGLIDTAIEFSEAGGTLTPDAIASVTSARSSLSTYATLINDEKAATTLTAPAFGAVLSQGWVTNGDVEAYTTAISSWLDGLVAKVNISSAASEVTLTSRTNAFPITISNDLDRTVYVQVTVMSSSSLILSVPTSQIIEVSPGDKVPATLTPTIYRDGDVTLVVHLQTETGSPIGDSATIHVTASQSAWMGWVIVIGAGVLFVVGTLVRVRTVSKKKAAKPDGSSSAG